MPFLTDTLSLIALPDGASWVLAKPMEYAGHDETWLVPVGFATDFASVPACLQWLAPRVGVYSRAAVLHDALCVKAHRGEMSRADADGVFRRVLRELGVPRVQQSLMWAGVRLNPATFLVDATAREVAQVAAITVLAAPLGAVPTAAVFLAQLLFHLLSHTRRKVAA